MDIIGIKDAINAAIEGNRLDFEDDIQKMLEKFKKEFDELSRIYAGNLYHDIEEEVMGGYKKW